MGLMGLLRYSTDLATSSIPIQGLTHVVGCEFDVGPTINYERVTSAATRRRVPAAVNKKDLHRKGSHPSALYPLRMNI